ncbi:hypothetical protein B0H14DRAFT_2581961 [Mycena olivaceomarginata]|nr:hypothetical protein B0H14DRAFT_2581961 [Mycena olivaceomarginata]
MAHKQASDVGVLGVRGVRRWLILSDSWAGGYALVPRTMSSVKWVPPECRVDLSHLSRERAGRWRDLRSYSESLQRETVEASYEAQGRRLTRRFALRLRRSMGCWMVCENMTERNLEHSVLFERQDVPIARPIRSSFARHSAPQAVGVQCAAKSLDTVPHTPPVPKWLLFPIETRNGSSVPSTHPESSVLQVVFPKAHPTLYSHCPLAYRDPFSPLRRTTRNYPRNYPRLRLARIHLVLSNLVGVRLRIGSRYSLAKPASHPGRPFGLLWRSIPDGNASRFAIYCGSHATAWMVLGDGKESDGDVKRPGRSTHQQRATLACDSSRFLGWALEKQSVPGDTRLDSARMKDMRWMGRALVWRAGEEFAESSSALSQSASIPGLSAFAPSTTHVASSIIGSQADHAPSPPRSSPSADRRIPGLEN